MVSADETQIFLDLFTEIRTSQIAAADAKRPTTTSIWKAGLQLGTTQQGGHGAVDEKSYSTLISKLFKRIRLFPSVPAVFYPFMDLWTYKTYKYRSILQIF